MAKAGQKIAEIEAKEAPKKAELNPLNEKFELTSAVLQQMAANFAASTRATNPAVFALLEIAAMCH